MIRIRESDNTVSFELRVQPRASKTELAGEYDGALKLRVCAPPVEGKANQACIEFLSKLLDVSKRNIEIISGDLSRNKTVRITGVTSDYILAILSK
jgi:hypothetical protein